MRRSGLTLVEAVVLVAIILVLGALLMPPRHSGGRYRDRAYCQSNLRQIGKSMGQYLLDYDRRFPPVLTVTGRGWSELLEPYLESRQTFQCPSAQLSDTSKTDFFYNPRFPYQRLKDIKKPEITILAGDGMDDSPPNYALDVFPTSWHKDEKSPAQRHLRRGNCLFADGHASSLSFESGGKSLFKGSAATFAIR